MSTEPLVSVLTPVYNGAAHIGDCIASVLSQEYENWEYKIIDNASTDGTDSIISDFAKRDQRIQHLRFAEFVDSNENHNRAFRAANPESEFVKIVQAPDWIYPGCLSQMVAAARQSDSIGLVIAYQRSDSGVDLADLPQTETFVDGRQALRRQLLGEIAIFGGPTSLLLRTAAVLEREPFYDGRYWHADHDAAFAILTRYDLGFAHEVLTFERRQAGRIMERAGRMNTYSPEFICFLLRYGPVVLESKEYRERLRSCLREYLWWHVRQVPRPSRMRDVEFFELQWTESERILELGKDDADVRAAIRAIRVLLARRGTFRRTRGQFALPPGVQESRPSRG